MHNNFYIEVKKNDKKEFLSLYKKNMKHHVYKCCFDIGYLDEHLEEITPSINEHIIDKFVYIDKSLRNQKFKKSNFNKYIKEYNLKKKYFGNISAVLEIRICTNRRKGEKFEQHFDKISYLMTVFMSKHSTARCLNYTKIAHQGFISFDDISDIHIKGIIEETLCSWIKKFGM